MISNFNVGLVIAITFTTISICFAQDPAKARAGERTYRNYCATCHGDRLTGNGDTAPGIAGRSPSYLARQLYDFHTGSRNGEMAATITTSPASVISVSQKMLAVSAIDIVSWRCSGARPASGTFERPR